MVYCPSIQGDVRMCISLPPLLICNIKSLNIMDLLLITCFTLGDCLCGCRFLLYVKHPGSIFKVSQVLFGCLSNALIAYTVCLDNWLILVRFSLIF